MSFRARVQLAYTAPLLPDSLFGHLAATAIPGVEEWRDGAYRRTVSLHHGPGTVSLRPAPDHVELDLDLASDGDHDEAVARCRFLLDLDADPAAVDTALAADPVLTPVVRAAPGRRIPRTVDADELAVRTVLGQQVSTAAARTHAARLTQSHGRPFTDDRGGLTRIFPTAADLTALDPDSLRLPMARRRTLTGLVAALAEQRVRLGLDLPESQRARCRAELTALPGIGPWTVDTVAMRALGDDDAFLVGDLGVRATAAALGLPATPATLARHAAGWSPWRSYAVQYLWSTGDHAVNQMPEPKRLGFETH